jgi:hypothetical protein
MVKNRTYFGLSEMTEDEFSHVCDLASSVLLTRDGVMLGGSFVRAIVDNDLNGAVGRADATAIKALKAFVVLKNNCDVFIAEGFNTFE